MRITNKMIGDQVIQNLTHNINRFMNMQNQMSTGRRINRPSDDPTGTIKDLSYRSRLSEIDQFQKNISEGKNWLSSVDTTLGDITTMISQAKEVAVELANDTYDATARESVSGEVESLFQQVLQSGNLQINGRFLFAGHMTRTQAFQASSKGVVYQGDQGSIKIDIESATNMSINIPGAELLTKPFRVLGEDSDYSVGVNGATSLADLNSGRGIDLSPGSFVVTDQNLGNSVTITIPPGTTDLAGLMTTVNAQLTAGGIDNLTLSLGLEGNNLRLVATDKPDVALTTPLANINNGTGLGAGAHEFIIHNADYSTEVHVDLTSAATVGDAINTINAALTAAGVANVTASLNAAVTGIDIADTNVVPLGLTVSEISNETFTAANLGLLGDISPVLNGADLNPIPDFAVAESAVGETTAADMGILGNMHKNMVGKDLDPNITLTTPLSLMNNGQGYELGRIFIAQGSGTAYVDLAATGINTIGDLINSFNSSGLSIQANINSTAKGVQIESTVVGQSLLIEDVVQSNSAYRLGIAGSPDIAGNFIFLVDALKNNDQRSINYVIDSLEKGLNHILNERASVGAKVIRLETTESRLADYNLEVTKLLSETEGADMTKLIADLAVQQNAYTAALNSAAKIIQPSLLDFIRG